MAVLGLLILLIYGDSLNDTHAFIVRWAPFNFRCFSGSNRTRQSQAIQARFDGAFGRAWVQRSTPQLICSQRVIGSGLVGRHPVSPSPWFLLYESYLGHVDFSGLYQKKLIPM